MKGGVTREELTYKDFESVVKEFSSLKTTTLCEHDLIDRYLPYLPIDSDSLILCIIETVNKRFPSMKVIKNEEIQNIVENLIDWPEHDPAFSESGCRHVDTIVDEMFAEKEN